MTFDGGGRAWVVGRNVEGLPLLRTAYFEMPNAAPTSGSLAVPSAAIISGVHRIRRGR